MSLTDPFLHPPPPGSVLVSLDFVSLYQSGTVHVTHGSFSPSSSTRKRSCVLGLCLLVPVRNCPCHSRILFSILLHQEAFLCPWTLSPCTSQEHPVSPGTSLLGHGGLVGIIHLHCSPEQ